MLHPSNKKPPLEEINPGVPRNSKVPLHGATASIKVARAHLWCVIQPRFNGWTLDWLKEKNGSIYARLSIGEKHVSDSNTGNSAMDTRSSNNVTIVVPDRVDGLDLNRKLVNCDTADKGNRIASEFKVKHDIPHTNNHHLPIIMEGTSSAKRGQMVQPGHPSNLRTPIPAYSTKGYSEEYKEKHRFRLVHRPLEFKLAEITTLMSPPQESCASARDENIRRDTGTQHNGTGKSHKRPLISDQMANEYNTPEVRDVFGSVNHRKGVVCSKCRVIGSMNTVDLEVNGVATGMLKCSFCGGMEVTVVSVNPGVRKLALNLNGVMVKVK